MTPARPAGAGTAVVAALLLNAASPPGWFPGAGLLVLPGLAALYRVARRATHPYRWGYAVGLCHMFWFSWSLRHVTGPGLVAIGVLGAVYFVLAVAWTRAFAARGLGVLGFALGIAATAWLRGHVPEVAYPHGQPAHALYHWPVLLGPVRWGGELCANGLFAAVAAGLGGLVDGGRRDRVTLGVAALLWGLGAVFRPAVDAAADGPATLRVAALQSDYPIRFERVEDGLRALARETARVAGPEVAAPPELVLWPESAWPVWLVGDPPRPERTVAPPIGPGVALCAGTMARSDAGRRAVAVLLDARGTLLGVQEKRVSVPAGERIPFLHWLPDGLAQWALDAIGGIIGFRPDQLDGRRMPPLRTASGVPFAAMTCFDNAFPVVARDAVDDGARLLTVLSNESWYVQGAELEQMVAMSVFRALETGTPVVRSTVDGVTCHVDADGVVLEILPRAPAQGPRALVAEVRLGPGRRSAFALDGPWLAILVLGSGIAVPLRWAGGRRRRRREGTSAGEDPRS